MNPIESAPLETRRVAAGALLRLWPRLIVAYLLVGVLLYSSWSEVAVVVAHAAHSLVLAFNPIPYIYEIAWEESGYRLLDRITFKERVVRVPGRLFIIGFPLGFSLALPGIRAAKYWWRVFWTLIASLVVSSLALAIITEGFLAGRLAETGIEIHAKWYEQLSARFILSGGIWDVMMYLYPFIACLLLARAALIPDDFEITGLRRRNRSAKRSRLPRGNLTLLMGLLVLVSAIELRAQDLRERPREALLEALAERNPELGKSLIRLELRAQDLRERPREALLEALAERNPELGKSLIHFADSLATRGRYREALFWYRKAGTYEGYAMVAGQRIRKVRHAIQSRARKPHG